MLKKIQKKISGYFDVDGHGKLTASETEFLPAVLEVVETPPSPVGRAVLWTIFALVGIGLLWSIFGHVDEVAIAPGKLIPVGFVKTIQAEDKGVVKAIHVQDGQQVKQGQLLMELDPTSTAADLARIKKEVSYYELEIARLTAEQEDRVFSPPPGPEVNLKDQEYQMRLFQSRQNEYKSKVAAAEASIRQSQSSLESGQANKVKLASLFTIAKEREDRIERLVRENAIAEFVLLDYRSKRMELEQNLVAQESEVARLESVILQGRQSLSTIIAERARDIDTKLVEDRKQMLAYSEELKKATERERLSRIVAPVDGRVTQLAMHTLGGIVTAAQALMVIVPEGGSLRVEAWVANKDIGFIQQGQRAEVKVETFSFQKYGTIDATVEDISADAVDDKDKGRVYRVVLNLDKEAVKVGDKDIFLGPGMTASAEIKIRQKRIIEFFLDPFRQYQSEALRER